jgi:hypothetical protein
MRQSLRAFARAALSSHPDTLSTGRFHSQNIQDFGGVSGRGEPGFLPGTQKHVLPSLDSYYWPLLIFTMVGTIGIVLLLKTAFQSQRHFEFLTLAEADTDHIRDSIEAKKQDSSTGVLTKANADLLKKSALFKVSLSLIILINFLESKRIFNA